MWSEELDLLRSVNRPLKKLRDPQGSGVGYQTSLIAIGYPYHDSIQTNYFTHRQISHVFGMNWGLGWLSRAECYIRSNDMPNPANALNVEQESQRLLEESNWKFREAESDDEDFYEIVDDSEVDYPVGEYWEDEWEDDTSEDESEDEDEPEVPEEPIEMGKSKEDGEGAEDEPRAELESTIGEGTTDSNDQP